MTWLDFLVLIFASRGLVDAWRNGDIFAERRATVEVYQDSDKPLGWQHLIWNLVTGWGLLWDLLMCDYCLSHWAGWFTALGLLLVPFVPPWAVVVIRTVAYGFAAMQIGWLLDQSLPKWLRYDRRQPVIPDAQEVPDGPADSTDPSDVR